MPVQLAPLLLVVLLQLAAGCAVSEPASLASGAGSSTETHQQSKSFPVTSPFACVIQWKAVPQSSAAHLSVVVVFEWSNGGYTERHQLFDADLVEAVGGQQTFSGEYQYDGARGRCRVVVVSKDCEWQWSARET